MRGMIFEKITLLLLFISYLICFHATLPILHPISFPPKDTASVAGLRGTPAMVAYASSKAAVLAMTVSTSKDLAPFKIRVNAVSPALIGPGYMWTRQNELHAQSGSPYFDTVSLPFFRF